jgi:hypothetical protein
MQANVILYQPNLPNYLNLRAYEDYARNFVWGLNKIGIKTHLLINEYDSSADMNFIFGAQVMPLEVLNNFRGICYYVNLEQVFQIKIDKFNLSPQIKFIIDNWTIIEYTKFNMDFWERMAAINVKLLPVAYGPTLSDIDFKIKKDIDLLYYGSLGEHMSLKDDFKLKFLAACASSSKMRPTIVFLQNNYDSLRSELIARSRIIISVTSDRIFPGVRSQYLIANRKPIISSIKADDLIDDYFKENIKFSTIDEVGYKISNLLSNEDDLNEYSEKLFSSFSKIRIDELLEKILFVDQ